MIVLLPISRFRISYQVAAGRPYSMFERLILRAIQEGAGDIASLRKTFQLHPRLLVEALVTLTQAGWLAVGGTQGHEFVLTADGREAATSDRPPTSRKTFDKETTVVMERLTGRLIANDSVRFLPRQHLDEIWDRSLKLREQVLFNHLDEGQVQHLLPRSQDEWLAWVGPIEMLSRNTHWIPVNVDLDSVALINLPDSWRSQVGPAILKEARDFARSADLQTKSLTWPELYPRIPPRADAVSLERDIPRLPITEWPAAIGPDDFLWTEADHIDYFARVLDEATSAIFVASAFISVNRLEAIKDRIIHALDRGVSIDLLWGYGSGQLANDQDGVEWLKKLAYEAKRDGRGGKLQFNAIPSGSHAKIILWNCEDTVEACVGSFNWLSAGVTRGGGQKITADESSLTDLSLCLRRCGILPGLVRCGAALWSGAKSGVLDSTADRWRRVASELERDLTETTFDIAGAENATVQLQLDRDHEALLRGWLTDARHRLLIASHKLGPAAETRLPAAIDRERATDFSFDVIYEQAEVDGEDFARLEDLVVRAGGRFRRASKMHAKVLVCDENACLSSYNFLSADPFGTAVRTRELGVMISGVEPTNWIMERVYQQ